MNTAWLTQTPFDVVPFAAGYVFAVVGGLLVGRIVAGLWKILRMRQTSEQHLTWFGQLIGHVEVVLYATAWVLGFPLFVGLWLTLKAGAQWGNWAEDRTDAAGFPVPGRSVFDAFLVGNGLSAAYGVIGGQVILWLRDGQAAQAVAAMAALLAASLLLLAFVGARVARVAVAAASAAPAAAPVAVTPAPAAAAPSGAARPPRTAP